MKMKIYFFSVFAMISVASFGQFKVDSSGKIFWGKSNYYNTPTALYFADEYTGYSGSSFYGFRIVRSANGNVSLARSNYKMVFYPLSGSMAIGNMVPEDDPFAYVPLYIFASTYGGVHLKMTTSGGAIGFRSQVDELGGKPFAAYYNNNAIFYMYGNGQVYANGSLLTSDISLKSNIELISKPLDKVKQLRGVTYNMNFPKNEDEAAGIEDTFEKMQKSAPTLTRELFKQIQEEKLRKQAGIIAQEVEKVMPEAVRTREDGLKAVSYSDLTALLIEAIKEQQTQIEDLQSEIAQLKGSKLSESGLRSSSIETEISDIDPIIAQCKLYQNAPNPFSQETQIRYYLPESVQTAFLCLYDRQGKQLKQYVITQRGEGAQKISAHKLAAGIYLYGLIANGKATDVKQMILTK